MEYYSLGNNIVAFTTDRTIGRDGDRLIAKFKEDGMTNSSHAFFYPHQTHTDKVIRIDEHFLALDAEAQRATLEGVDAVISNVRDVVLGISTADCIPVLVYDPEHHAAAAIHAGWKGTVQHIVQKAVAAMQTAYGTRPSECLAAIGPGISMDSFEVGQEVVDAFDRASLLTDRDSVLRYYEPSALFSGNTETAPHLDLKEINRQQLTGSGLTVNNIYVSDIDTFTDERFFSARREQKGNIKCGRILTGFLLQ